MGKKYPNLLSGGDGGGGVRTDFLGAFDGEGAVFKKRRET